jgi:hypothetical protein
MPIEVQSWDEVSQADYDAARALLTQIVSERHPEIYTRRGTISDLVLTLHGVLGGAGRLERTRLLLANSLQAIAANPGLADSDLVDALLANYRVTRDSGNFAVGSVTLVLTRPVPTVVPSGFAFTSGLREFVTTGSFAARLSAGDILSPTDRVLTEQADGTFTFSVDVKANSLGLSGMLRQGDAVALSRPIPNVSRAFAGRDFVDGRDAESNADLYARLQLGVAARTWSNAVNLAALVREQTNFADAIVSIVGAGDPEMLRDKHSLFPIAYGNRIDVWVKTPRQPVALTITKTATYVSTGANGPIWSIALDRDDLPAAYHVRDVLRTGRSAAAAVAPTSFTRLYAARTADPDLTTALEAGFSRFQSGTLLFEDAAAPDDVLVANETTAEYTVTSLALEHVADLQSLLTASAIKPPAGDIVVRAAVPCLLSVELDFASIPEDLPRADIAAALSDHVNKSGFNSAIYASRLVTIAAAFLADDVNLNRVRLSGIILGPDGSRKLYRSHESLTAPNDPGHMITPATVAFYLDPIDVSFNLV